MLTSKPFAQLRSAIDHDPERLRRVADFKQVMLDALRAGEQITQGVRANEAVKSPLADREPDLDRE